MSFHDPAGLIHHRKMSLLKAQIDAAWRQIAANYTLHTGDPCPKMRDVLAYSRTLTMSASSKVEKP